MHYAQSVDTKMSDEPNVRIWLGKQKCLGGVECGRLSEMTPS